MGIDGEEGVAHLGTGAVPVVGGGAAVLGVVLTRRADLVARQDLDRGIVSVHTPASKL